MKKMRLLLRDEVRTVEYSGRHPELVVIGDRAFKLISTGMIDEGSEYAGMFYGIYTYGETLFLEEKS